MLAPVAASRQDDHHDERLDLGRPAGGAARQEVRQDVCGTASASSSLQGGSDVGIADVAAGRVTIGNSSRDPKPSDPGGLVFNKIARDAVCIVTNPATRSPDSTRPGPGDLRRRRPQLERGPGRHVAGTIDVDRPHRRLRYPGRVPEDLHGLDASVFVGASQKASNGLVQQTVTADPNAIGYVSLDFTSGTHADPLQGRRLHPAQRQVRPVRRRAQLLHGHPRRRHGRSARSASTGSRTSSAGREDHRHRVGPAQLVRRPTLRPESGARGRRQRGPARRAAARRAGVRVLLSDRRHDHLRLREGVAVVLPQRPGLVRRAAATSTTSSTDIFNSPADPSHYDYTLHAWPLLYATALITGGRGAARRRLLAALGDLHRRVRARPRLRRVLEPVVRLLAAVPSVVYGLIGILVLVPFVGNHLISERPEGIGRST